MLKFKGVIYMHELIEKRYPPGHKDRGRMLECAHEYYRRATNVARGRPKGDADDHAIFHMSLTEHFKGESCARKLAELAIDASHAPNTGGSRESRIERLARKYTKRRALRPGTLLFPPARPVEELPII